MRGWRPPYIGVERWFPGLLGANSFSTDVGFAREILSPKLGASGAWGGLTKQLGRSNQAQFSWSPPLAGGLRGSLALLRLMGPSCIELLWLCFGPILDHVGLSCVDLRVSLVVCHGLPRFRLLITEIHY
jgi:hypothetical protein